MDSKSYSAIMRMSQEKPEWIDVVEKALEYADKINNTGFAGAWINDIMKREYNRNIGNLRTLTSYEIIEVTMTSRGGNRAYYRFIEPEEVRRALVDLKQKQNQNV